MPVTDLLHSNNLHPVTNGHRMLYAQGVSVCISYTTAQPACYGNVYILGYPENIKHAVGLN